MLNDKSIIFLHNMSLVPPPPSFPAYIVMRWGGGGRRIRWANVNVLTGAEHMLAGRYLKHKDKNTAKWWDENERLGRGGERGVKCVVIVISPPKIGSFSFENSFFHQYSDISIKKYK